MYPYNIGCLGKLEAEEIEPASLVWVLQILSVPKKVGSLSISVDYRWVRNTIAKNAYMFLRND